jgi:tetratricopeptide (TPR) repeat protein
MLIGASPDATRRGSGSAIPNVSPTIRTRGIIILNLGMLDTDDPRKKVAYQFEEARRLREQGKFREAEALMVDAKQLVAADVQACAEIDLFRVMSFLEENRQEEGLRNLSAMLIEYADWFETPDGRDVYELVQIQRAFSLMHLQRNPEARPLLEEAMQFQLDAEVRSDVHCHLGRCYHELSLYILAKEQFDRADTLGVSEGWQPAFHYYYGYTLYELREFQRAKREFILCLQAGPSGPEPALRYSMLAATSRRLGEHSEARGYEERAKSLKL